MSVFRIELNEGGSITPFRYGNGEIFEAPTFVQAASKVLEIEETDWIKRFEAMYLVNTVTLERIRIR